MKTNESYIKVSAIGLLGLVFPIITLFFAGSNINKLSEQVTSSDTLQSVIQEYKDVRADISTANEFAFISMLTAENANQKTMINKQVMKVAVMQIGFAVISIGLLFILLGFNDGGAEGRADLQGISFDFKTSSSGLVALIMGGLMATFGGVLKNDYSTVEVPKYFVIGSDLSAMKQSTKVCQKISLNKEAYYQCMGQSFIQNYDWEDKK
jgi:hypothetical protein